MTAVAQSLHEMSAGRKDSGFLDAQAIELLSGKFLHGKLANKSGRLQKLIAAGKKDDEIVREIYLSALAREPSKTELQFARQHISQSKNRTAALADVCWSVFNLSEFLFQH